MTKGEIFEGTKRGADAARHPIVYLEGNDDKSFFGAVLTHAPKPDNTLMAKGHFKEIDSKGNKCKFSFDNTHVVGRRFFKPKEWGPYTKVGELTDEGIIAIEAAIRELKAVHWDDYIKL